MVATILPQIIAPAVSTTPEQVASVIQIGTIQAFFAVAAVLVGIGIAWGTLRTLMKGVKDVLEKEIKPDLKNVRERFIVVEDRVKVLWKDEYAPASSPRKLNDRGTTVLHDSGIKKIIDDKKSDLLALVRQKETTNAYDTEQAVLTVVSEIPQKFPELLPQLKDGAFKTGADIDSLLLVGGIYLRDLIFPNLGFPLEDLDKPKN